MPRPSAAACSTPVHPRARGERKDETGADAHASGSSPRARGTCDGGHERNLGGRFIPARAGNVTHPRRPPSRSTVHPRARGERRFRVRGSITRRGSSPRARGTCRDGGRLLLGARFIPARAGNVPRGSGRRRNSTVHPRARGERAEAAEQRPAQHGSSPRARGTYAVEPRRVGRARFIPARAGNVTRGLSTARFRAVHPRARGERPVIFAVPASFCGSSPRARGTWRGRAHGQRRAGFIPARAGNVSRITRCSRAGTVHPRARGERFERAIMGIDAGGSSPRARGTYHRSACRTPNTRFIPARAGNVCGRKNMARTNPVHPRARGERPMRKTFPDQMYGSSPRARGTCRTGSRSHPADRFIPARAGNVARRSPPRRALPVHPRARGEREHDTALTLGKCGSSPRARGTSFRSGARVPSSRFIPARAGNVGCRKIGRAGRSVHPRARGERASCASVHSPASGSSPRARGTSALHAALSTALRFIPARAGNVSP